MRKNRKQAGGAMVEMALLTPWILFLFICIFDLGFYSYASICTQNAARAAALRAAIVNDITQSPAFGCAAALNELDLMPNVRTASPAITCPANTLPVVINVIRLDCTSSTPLAADCLNQQPPGVEPIFSWQASVQYQTDSMFWTPWLTNQLTLTRIAEVRSLL